MIRYRRLQWLLPSLVAALIGIGTARGGISILLVLSAVAAVRSLTFVSRAAVSLSLFLLFALESSQGKILHSGHLWLWVSFLLLCLPEPGPRQVGGHQTRLVVAWVTALIFLVYSTAGLSKLAVSFLRWPGWFGRNSLSEIVAIHALKGGVVAAHSVPPSWGLALTVGYFACLAPAFLQLFSRAERSCGRLAC